LTVSRSFAKYINSVGIYIFTLWCLCADCV
jgi:hypothetical protein